MRAEQAVAFVVFSVAAAGTPGPSNALLTATGTNVGVLRGLPTLLGQALGMGLMMFVIGFGLGSIILATAVLLSVVKWCGAAFLLWLAWKIASASGHSVGESQRPVGFFGAAAFQWVNPKSWLVATSAAATFLDQTSGSAVVQSAALGFIFSAVALPACLPWLAFGAVMQRLLRSERALRIFNVSMGVLLAASVVLIVFD
jgi:threonine/homoserine/homoserine lactone efflux protein